MKLTKLLNIATCLIASFVVIMLIKYETMIPNKHSLIESRYSRNIKGRYISIEDNIYSGFNFFSIDKDSIKFENKDTGTADCYLDQASSFHRKCTLKKTDYLKIDNALSDGMYYVVSNPTVKSDGNVVLRLSSVDSSTLKSLGVKYDKEITLKDNDIELSKDSVVKMKDDGSMSIVQNPTYSGRYYPKQKSYYEIKVSGVGAVNKLEELSLKKGLSKSYGLEYLSDSESRFKIFLMIAPFMVMISMFVQIIIYARRKSIEWLCSIVLTTFIASMSSLFINEFHSVIILLYFVSLVSILLFMYTHSLRKSA